MPSIPLPLKSVHVVPDPEYELVLPASTWNTRPSVTIDGAGAGSGAGSGEATVSE